MQILIEWGVRMSLEEHERFFTELLGNIDEPTAPFGLMDVHLDGSRVRQAYLALSGELSARLRGMAKRLGVSLASLFHLAWGQVLSKATDRADVVFGTVLFGRMQAGEGADQAMGLFINTLPVKLSLDEATVTDSVRQTHQLLADLLRHEHAPLALAQRCSGVSAPAPLFTCLLNYRHNKPMGGDTASHLSDTADLWSGVSSLNSEERTNYPITLSVEDFGQDLGLTAQVLQPLEPARICGYMHKALEGLVEALEKAPETKIHTVEILPQTERHQLLVEWNATDAAYPKDKCIHGLFEEQVARAPDAIALIQDQEQLTHGELNTRANQLAHYLRALGVGPETCVAICVERRPYMVVGLLAILKAGGGYVTLDPNYPAERLEFMLEDSSPVSLLADTIGLKTLEGSLHQFSDASIVDLTHPEIWSSYPHTDVSITQTGLTSRNLAYVIYTSGSTGMPKGVMVEHKNVVNLVTWHCCHFNLTIGDRTSSIAGMGFDAGGWEIWPSLSMGASLALAPTFVAGDPKELLCWWERQSLNVSFLPTPLAEAAFSLGINNQKLEILLVGGDRLHSFATHHHFRLVNNYGPTEITVVATSGEVKKDDPNPHIGRPINNTRIYILDRYRQPVPIGVAGELYIGGAGVARGYLKRAELTAERFLSDPFGAAPEGRMYRTGDLARYRRDGNIEFLGRNDFQVKIRGFRIELGEIEARLCEHEDVREAVVIARAEEGEDKRLVAYVTLRESGSSSDLAQGLRAHLAALLPDYMVPSAFVVLERLPLTANGKLDRKALPAPDEKALARQEYEAPVGEIEIVLARVWSELLHVEHVSRQDNFFELGGDSLLAVRLMSRLQQQFSVELPLSALFSCPRLRDLAQAIGRLETSLLPPITAVSRGGTLPLSFAQQRLWVLAQFEGVSESYHMPFGLRLRGVLDEGALKKSLDHLWRRHEGLRSSFGMDEEGLPFVKLLDASVGLVLREYDLEDWPDAEEQLLRIAREAAIIPFDLNTGPLIRGCLVRLFAEEHVLLITQHHIVSDGWSMGILLNELSSLYSAFSRGERDPLPPLPVHYSDYAVWQRQFLSGDHLRRQSEYWRKALKEAPVVLELPTDRPRPAQQDLRGASLEVVLDAQLTARLKKLSQEQGVTLFMTLLAGWSVVLSRLSGSEDIVIGTPTANRNRVEIEGLIGFFVNTLALRIDLSGEVGVKELLGRVKHQALEAQHHQELPFEQVVEIVQPPRHLSHTPLFQVMFAWQNNEGGELSLPGLEVAPFGGAVESIKFDLELDLAEDGTRIGGEVRYSKALFDEETIRRHIGYLKRVLQAFVDHWDQSVSQIEILSEAERHQLLVEWNATDAAYPKDKCIHELFEEQVARAPDAIALIQDQEQLTYAELNTRANQLAHYLRALGVGPETCVAICVERRPYMVVGLLAILKAGGAYVPLDPNYPAERLEFMLEDSSPVSLLADTIGLKTLEGSLHQFSDASIVDLTHPEIWSSYPHTDVSITQTGLTSRNLAYVIYTSGSTGMPKGVMVEHKNVVNLFEVTDKLFGFNEQDVWTLFHSVAFDFSVWELWGGLLHGGKVVIVPYFTARSPELFYQLICHQGVTV